MISIASADVNAGWEMSAFIPLRAATTVTGSSNLLPMKEQSTLTIYPQSMRRFQEVFRRIVPVFRFIFSWGHSVIIKDRNSTPRLSRVNETNWHQSMLKRTFSPRLIFLRGEILSQSLYNVEHGSISARYVFELYQLNKVHVVSVYEPMTTSFTSSSLAEAIHVRTNRSTRSITKSFWTAFTSQTKGRVLDQCVSLSHEQ